MANKKPILIYTLAILLMVQAIGALYGGIALVIKPDGSLLRMPLSILTGSLFYNFFIPGLILLSLLGVFPFITAVCLITSPAMAWPNVLNINKAQHWALTYVQYIGAMLIIFIAVELIVTQTYMILQPVFALLGLVIILISVSPSVYRYYSLPGEIRVLNT